MCAAPAGNRFWELRSKHGRDALFDSPELLWAAACEYFEWCEENPLLSIDFKGKDAVKVTIPKMRAFTWQGLTSYLGCDTSYFRNFKTRCSEDFLTVITRIDDTMFNQKFIGAAADLLNSNIIARDLGLIDKKNLAVDGDITVEYLEGPNETVD